MSTSAEIQARQEAIQKEADSFIGKLQGDLETAQRQRFTQEHQDELQRKIDQARQTYDVILGNAATELQAAREEETRQAAAKDHETEQAAAEEKKRIYDQLRRVWIENRGDPAAFDAAFPQLYQEEMTRRVLKSSDEQISRANRNVINKAF